MTRVGDAALDGENDLFLSIQRSGPFTVSQFDRSARVDPGSAVLFDSSAPFDLVRDAPTTCVTLRVAATAASIRRTALREVVAVPLDLTNVELRVLDDVLRSLIAVEDAMDDSSRRRMEKSLGSSSTAWCKRISVNVSAQRTMVRSWSGCGLSCGDNFSTPISRPR